MWHVTARVPKHPAQDLPPIIPLGTVRAADADSALFVARIEFGDQPGLHVQSALSAQVADDERQAIAKRRPVSGNNTIRREPTGPFRKCRQTGCNSSIRRRLDGYHPEYCGKHRGAQ